MPSEDYRIQFHEPMVGANHPCRPDTLNRLALVEAGPDGHGRRRFLAAQDAPPVTGPDEGVLYTRRRQGALELYFRREAEGPEVCLSRPPAAPSPGRLVGLAPVWAGPDRLEVSPGSLAGQGSWRTLRQPLAVDLPPMAGEPGEGPAWWAVYLCPPGAGGSPAGHAWAEAVGDTPPRRDPVSGLWTRPDRPGAPCLGLVLRRADGLLPEFLLAGGFWGLARPLPLTGPARVPPPPLGPLWAELATPAGAWRVLVRPGAAHPWGEAPAGARFQGFGPPRGLAG
ncbi:MAG: hypothetical protein KQJ78_22255 [Deltaproteobacteria bacterium]|nr:hypothetical protein [Deltaproteobacteria bacterium]